MLFLLAGMFTPLDDEMLSAVVGAVWKTGYVTAPLGILFAIIALSRHPLTRRQAVVGLVLSSLFLWLPNVLTLIWLGLTGAL